MLGAPAARRVQADGYRAALLTRAAVSARGRQALRFWQQDDRRAGVRGAALAKLPEAERQAWQELWADVERTLRRVDHRDTTGTQKKPPTG